MNRSDTNVLFCECSHPTHQIVLNFDEPHEVYCITQLNNLSFLKRLKYAIKYIFGWKSKFGAFEEFIITDKHTEELEKVIKHIKR